MKLSTPLAEERLIWFPMFPNLSFSGYWATSAWIPGQAGCFPKVRVQPSWEISYELGLAPRAAQVLRRQVEPKNSVNTGDRLTSLIHIGRNTNNHL